MNLKAKLFLLLVFVVSSNTWADNQRLVVWQKNGKKVYYELADEPHTTFENGILIISSNRIRNEYQLSEILRYTYEGTFTNIEAPHGDGMGFRQNGDELDIFGLPQGTEALLYNVNGIMLDSRKADGQNAIHFSLASKPTGTYLVKIGEQTLKFMKR